MNHSAVGLFCALSAASSLGYCANANADCRPAIIQQEAEFPGRAIARGQQGTVFVEVLVGESGRAATAEIVDSSGYRLLDQAAKQTALTRWEFDVSSCERKDLPVKHRIAVEYRNDQ